MTNTEIIQAIKAEIDRRYEENREKARYDDYYRGMNDGLDHFEQFIDTLESEKPMQEELDKEIEKVLREGALSWNISYSDMCFIAEHFYELGKKDMKEQMMKDYPKWRRIKTGERLPCPAYVWTIAYDNYPDCFEGRLMPNIQGVKVGRDTWYLPVDVIHNLPKEDNS